MHILRELFLSTKPWSKCSVFTEPPWTSPHPVLTQTSEGGFMSPFTAGETEAQKSQVMH